MIQTFNKILELLEPDERTKFFILLGLMVPLALAELLGLSAMLLLLNTLADPVGALDSKVLAWAYRLTGSDSIFVFQLVLSTATLFVVDVGLAIKAWGRYTIIRFSTMRGYSLSFRLLQRYLNQPYGWFLGRNSAEIRNNILGQVDGLVNRVLMPFSQLVASGLQIAVVAVFLLLVDPWVTLISVAAVGFGYGFIFLRFRSLLAHAGSEQFLASQERFRLADEAMGGIKEVKVMGLESSYIERFRKPALRNARMVSIGQVLGELPRYLLEAIISGTLLLIVMVLLFRTGGNLVETIPTLGIFAFAVMRLMPSAQQMYFGFASIRGGSAVLERIHSDYVQSVIPAAAPQLPASPIVLDKELELRSISFAYEAAPRATLEGLDLAIGARKTIGIVGGTGAGKTTLVDIILGLLKPTSGDIFVDGKKVGPENLRDWQCSLGYVPQSIYMADDSIERNIAFGVPQDKIDTAAVEFAAKQAALHDFITHDLPDRYMTIVGERGVRLSGGQRQRIGIARALYRNPTLLIMDEATSALDNLTERAVMEAIDNIRGDRTIILIAHRLSTVRNCDEIILLDRGRVEARGSFAELLATNERFKEMAKSI